MAGSFIWYSLMTDDIAAASAFYSAVVGWGTREREIDGKSQMILLAGKTPIGTIAPLPEGARPAWLGFVDVADVDASVAQLRGLGGKVHRQGTNIPDVGRYAVVSDPQGAVFLLLHRTRPAPAPVTGTGCVAWHELLAQDGPAALPFYSAMLGWTEAGTMELGAMGTYRMFATGGAAIGGIMSKPPAVPVPVWIYYIEVDSIDAAGTRVREGGGSVMHGPTEVPGGQWILQCLDPQGAMFALVGKRA